MDAVVYKRMRRAADCAYRVLLSMGGNTYSTYCDLGKDNANEDEQEGVAKIDNLKSPNKSPEKNGKVKKDSFIGKRKASREWSTFKPKSRDKRPSEAKVDRSYKKSRSSHNYKSNKPRSDDGSRKKPKSIEAGKVKPKSITSGWDKDDNVFARIGTGETRTPEVVPSGAPPNAIVASDNNRNHGHNIQSGKFRYSPAFEQLRAKAKAAEKVRPKTKENVIIKEESTKCGPKKSNGVSSINAKGQQGQNPISKFADSKTKVAPSQSVFKCSGTGRSPSSAKFRTSKTSCKSKPKSSAQRTKSAASQRTKMTTNFYAPNKDNATNAGGVIKRPTPTVQAKTIQPEASSPKDSSKNSQQ